MSQDQQQKGPYLGTIFETYKRPEIALAILDPNKTIAQGFATNVLTLKDDSEHDRIIADEQGEQLTLRDIAAQEHVINKASIIKRETLPTSMMPPRTPRWVHRPRNGKPTRLSRITRKKESIAMIRRFHSVDILGEPC